MVYGQRSVDIQQIGVNSSGAPIQKACVTPGIIESLRLEKNSKIIRSNRQPITTMTAKPCPKVPYLHVFEHLQEMVIPRLPWAASSNASELFQ